jgi:hypothetical protein
MRDLPAKGNIPALAVAAEGKGGRVTILVAAVRNLSPVAFPPISRRKGGGRVKSFPFLLSMATLLLLNLWSCVIGEVPPHSFTLHEIDGKIYFDIPPDGRKYEYACTDDISVDRVKHSFRTALFWWAAGQTDHTGTRGCDIRFPVQFGTGGSYANQGSDSISSGCYYVEAEILFADGGPALLTRFGSYFRLDSNLNLTEQERACHE